MSEPTNAQIAEQEDMRLDAQIDAWYDEHHQPVNRPEPFDWLNHPAIFDVLNAHLGRRAGSWYVITEGSGIYLYDTEIEAMSKCADLGMVHRYGFAKHLKGNE